MSKRTQQDSGEERVTAKSRPMMSLIARGPQLRHLRRQKAPGKKSYESQSPWSAEAEKYDRTVQPVVGRDTSHEHRHHHRFVESTHSARYSGWGTKTKLGLLKSGKLINRWMIERGNALSPLGQGHTSSNQVSLMRRPSTLFWKKKNLVIGTGTTRFLPSKRSKATAIYHWRRRSRIKIVNRNPDHSWIGWMIKCGKDTNDLRRMLQKMTKNILWYGECLCLVTLESAVIHGQELLRQSAFHQEYKRSHNCNKCSTYLQNWCPNKMRSMEWKQLNWLGRFFMELFVFDWWWTSHQSSAQKGPRLFRFCIVSW